MLGPTLRTTSTISRAPMKHKAVLPQILNRGVTLHVQVRLAAQSCYWSKSPLRPSSNIEGGASPTTGSYKKASAAEVRTPSALRGPSCGREASNHLGTSLQGSLFPLVTDPASHLLTSENWVAQDHRVRGNARGSDRYVQGAS